MHTYTIRLELLSKYRTPLMGIAALMIIAVHSCDYGVQMPNFIQRILMRGYLGVDIFLFLSGIGCYYSLSKNGSCSKWYKKRLVRIFIPYTLIQIPFWAYQISIGEFNIEKQLINFSTIGFWLHHVGAWYVALLIPLYLFTPPNLQIVVKWAKRDKSRHHNNNYILGVQHRFWRNNRNIIQHTA